MFQSIYYKIKILLIVFIISIFSVSSTVTNSAIEESARLIGGLSASYWLCEYPFWVGISYAYAGSATISPKDKMIVYSGMVYNIFLAPKENRNSVFYTNALLWIVWFLLPNDEIVKKTQIDNNYESTYLLVYEF